MGPLAVINRVITPNNRLINVYLKLFHPYTIQYIYIYIHEVIFAPTYHVVSHGFFLARNFRWSSLRDCCGSTPGSQLEAGVLTLSLITISAEISIPFIISGSICLLKLGKHCHCCVLFLIVLLMFVLFVLFVRLFVHLFYAWQGKKKTLWGTPEFTMKPKRVAEEKGNSFGPFQVW